MGETEGILSKKRHHGFSTPESYFDELPMRIADRIQTRVRQQSPFLRPSMAFASLLLCGTLVALYLFLKSEPAAREIILSENDIAHVVENPELYNIDTEDITEKYLSGNYESVIVGYGIPEDEIIDFLEKNADVNNIINEY